MLPGPSPPRKYRYFYQDTRPPVSGYSQRPNALKIPDEFLELTACKAMQLAFPNQSLTAMPNSVSCFRRVRVLIYLTWARDDSQLISLIVLIPHMAQAFSIVPVSMSLPLSVLSASLASETLRPSSPSLSPLRKALSISELDAYR